MIKKVFCLSAFIASDFLAVLVSFYLAFLIRLEILPSIFPFLLERPVFFEIYWNQGYMFCIWLVVFFYEKLYTKRYSFWEEARLLWKSTTISFVLVVIAVFVTRQYFPFSRPIIIMAWLFSPIFLLGFRYVVKSVVIGLGLWRKKVLIIGSGPSISALIHAITKNKTMGYAIVGCLTHKQEEVGNSINGIQVNGHYQEIGKWREELGFEDIIVSLPDLPRETIVELLKQWDQLCETIRYVPRTGELINTGVEIENIGDILSLSLRKNLHKPWNLFIKRVFEFILVTILFVALLPIFAIIAFSIWVDSKGPVFFIQERYGKLGKKIQIIKFRSMFVDNEDKLATYLEQNSSAQDEWGKYKKLRGYDPRVTRVGQFLRKFSLDELPQFLNVLRGEMSLVGPRPYIMEELKQVESFKALLLQVKPGITGLWQISGRSLLPFSDRLNLDEHYLRNWSFWMDIVILIKTVKVFLSAEGAY